MGHVLGDLALGYDAEWDSIPAAAVGAPHLRYRVWIIAYRHGDASRPDAHGERPHRAGVDELGDAELRDEQVSEPRSVGALLADTDSGRGDRRCPRPRWPSGSGRRGTRIVRGGDGEPHVADAIGQRGRGRDGQREHAADAYPPGEGVRLGWTASGGQLNPTWVEWLMGFPLGWTDLGPSATRSSRKSSSGSAGASSKRKP